MTISTFERNATIAEPADGGPPYRFDRYINGQRMAEGVLIEREKPLEAAMKAAARIASRGRNGEVPVLVLDATAVLAAARAVPADVEPFGYFCEHRLADPVFLRPPSYIPEPGPNSKVTPLYTAAALAASTAREKAKDAFWNERCADVQMLAHNWMVAHDKLQAGEPYDYPSPADLPEALKAKDEEIAGLREALANLDAAVGASPTAAWIRARAALSGRKPDTKEGT